MHNTTKIKIKFLLIIGTSIWQSTCIPEKDATFMFVLSISVCCPFRSLIVTLGNARKFSGP